MAKQLFIIKLLKFLFAIIGTSAACSIATRWQRGSMDEAEESKMHGAKRETSEMAKTNRLHTHFDKVSKAVWKSKTLKQQLLEFLSQNMCQQERWWNFRCYDYVRAIAIVLLLSLCPVLAHSLSTTMAMMTKNAWQYCYTLKWKSIARLSFFAALSVNFNEIFKQSHHLIRALNILMRAYSKYNALFSIIISFLFFLLFSLLLLHIHKEHHTNAVKCIANSQSV